MIHTEAGRHRDPCEDADDALSLWVKSANRLMTHTTAQRGGRASRDAVGERAAPAHHLKAVLRVLGASVWKSVYVARKVPSYLLTPCRLMILSRLA